MSSLSEVLKQRRKVLGLTLAQIADLMDVSEATVQRWESGNIKSVRYEKIAKLADILNVQPAALMGWDDMSNLNSGNFGVNKKDPTPVSEDGRNVIRMAGRDGSYVVRRLTDDQYAAFKAMLDQLPEADI